MPAGTPRIPDLSVSIDENSRQRLLVLSGSAASPVIKRSCAACGAARSSDRPARGKRKFEDACDRPSPPCEARASSRRVGPRPRRPSSDAWRYAPRVRPGTTRAFGERAEDEQLRARQTRPAAPRPAKHTRSDWTMRRMASSTIRALAEELARKCRALPANGNSLGAHIIWAHLRTKRRIRAKRGRLTERGGHDAELGAEHFDAAFRPSRVAGSYTSGAFASRTSWGSPASRPRFAPESERSRDSSTDSGCPGSCAWPGESPSPPADRASLPATKAEEPGRKVGAPEGLRLERRRTGSCPVNILYMVTPRP